jgi:hypothetical protein
MRLSSIFVAVLFAPLTLSAQTSPAIFAPPQSAQSCPVLLTVERLSNYGRIETGTPAQSDEQRKQSELTQQLHQLDVELQTLAQQKSALEAKLAQQGPTADPAVARDLRAQIQTLDASISAKNAEITALTGPTDVFLKKQLDEAKRALSEADQQQQGLSIAFIKPAARIVSADIVVHGYTASARIVPAAPAASGEVSEKFHAAASAEHPLLRSNLWPAHMAVISWVELTRLDYTDGTSWQSSTPRQCSAAPSLFVLVDSAR